MNKAIPIIARLTFQQGSRLSAGYHHGCVDLELVPRYHKHHCNEIQEYTAEMERLMSVIHVYTVQSEHHKGALAGVQCFDVTGEKGLNGQVQVNEW